MLQNKVRESVEYIQSQTNFTPEIAIILGTGLGKLVDEMDVETSIEYKSIPHFPEATIEFHTGRLLFGVFAGKKVVVMNGRFHLYEGYSQEEVTFGVRVVKELGAKKLFVSNAAGAVNLNFNKGELMLIDDHINLQGGSPLAFKESKEFGNIFVDMSAPYDASINNLLEETAREKGITLHKGVYASVYGPHLETRAEYRFLKIIGADAVGMSTVPEVIVANQIGMPCVAASVLTDECDPDKLQPINVPEILALAAEAEPKLIVLFKSVIEKI